jgi:CBS-domain-containing membrane protein
MRLNLREVAGDIRRGINLQNAAAGAVAGLGGAIAIGGMEWFSLAYRYPLAIVPFATSIVLVIGSPEAEPAQPRALVGGHIVSTLVGLLVLRLTGPAGINPLLVVSNNLAWSFLLAPVLAGTMLLTAFAWLWHCGIRRWSWPERWL